HHELLALQIGGISLKMLMRPFFLLALFCCIFLYCNFEFFLPRSLKSIDQFQEKYLKKKKKTKSPKTAFEVLILEDGSRIVYKSYHLSSSKLEDVYWILSVDELYSMKSLTRENGVPIGSFVDHLIRNADGIIEKAHSYNSFAFQTMPLAFDSNANLFTPIENRSISALASLLKEKSQILTDKSKQIKTQLYLKLLLPLLVFVALLASAPFCLKYSRNLPIFYIYAIAISSIVIFFALINACVILGENQVINPAFAIFTLPAILFIFFGKNFRKMC
ncbi:MAG: LptF/LptG family permease, partial [Simkaniaceae bacterium]|nr:LptF/LptG family permease [Simkaniaceae bacterium]